MSRQQEHSRFDVVFTGRSKRDRGSILHQGDELLSEKDAGLGRDQNVYQNKHDNGISSEKH